jgi:hypothetical protein
MSKDVNSGKVVTRHEGERAFDAFRYPTRTEMDDRIINAVAEEHAMRLLEGLVVPEDGRLYVHDLAYSNIRVAIIRYLLTVEDQKKYLTDPTPKKPVPPPQPPPEPPQPPRCYGCGE